MIMATIALGHLQMLWVLRTSSHLTHYVIHYLTSVSSTSAIWSALPSKCLCISTLLSLLMPPWSTWSKSPSFTFNSLLPSVPLQSFLHLCSLSISEQKPESYVTCRSLHGLPPVHPILLWTYLLLLFLLTLRFLWIHLASFRLGPLPLLFYVPGSLSPFRPTASSPLHLFKGSCLVSVYWLPSLAFGLLSPQSFIFPLPALFLLPHHVIKVLCILLIICLPLNSKPHQSRDFCLF